VEPKQKATGNQACMEPTPEGLRVVSFPDDKDELAMRRCGHCNNCLELKRVQQRVLAACNPPFSHADDGVVNLWNAELARLPCQTKKQEPKR